MNERILNALAELNAAIQEVEPTAEVSGVRVEWRTGKRNRIRLTGDLAQLIAWRINNTQNFRDVRKIERALYSD